METICFSMPGNEEAAGKIITLCRHERGNAEIRRFPDGESYVRILSDVKNKKVVVVCSLHEPDVKMLPLYYTAMQLKELGAREVCLVAPYLCYMRQDKAFRHGEAVTSVLFAQLMGPMFDEILTIDPHLHRWNSLSQLYHTKTTVKHASGEIARWITENVKKPLIVGPDSESKQWASEIASKAGAGFIVLQKERSGDREVKITLPQLDDFGEVTPVLIDDIISTGKTMSRAIAELNKKGLNTTVCVGIHAVFAANAYEELISQGTRVVTCNTIPHASNGIEVIHLLA